MYVKYVCPPGALMPHSEEGVVRFNIETQLPLLEDFFGRTMPTQDREQFIHAYKRGVQEDYGIVVDGKIVARAVIMNFESGDTEIGCVITRLPYRNRGYAKRIVGRCAAVLNGRGKNAMGITTVTNAAMRAVFEALGFVGTECTQREFPS